jgi:hypothetical protein
MALGRRRLAGGIVAFAARLRFPALFGLAAVLFVADLLLPDALPFVDEALLGLIALALARWRKPEGPTSEAAGRETGGSPD